MTDLDRTEILEADESITDTSAITHGKAALNVLSGADHQTFQLNKELTIGRSNPSDAIIPAPSLSKQHAKITVSNGQYFITDLGSSNKTFHNKIQLRPNVCYALHNGDEVKFGEVICSFEEPTGTDANAEKTEMNNHSVAMNDDPIKVRTSTNGVSKHNGVNESPDKSAIIAESPTAEDSLNEPTDMEDTPQQEPENITDDVPNLSDAKKKLSEEDMETEPTTDSPSMVIDDKPTENSNDMEAQSVSGDQEQEPATGTTRSSVVAAPEEAVEEQMQDEPAPVATRGVARKNARRARGRQAATARTRVVSTRLHRGRRNPIVAPTTKTEEANTTLEETVSTEVEESPKKTTPAREAKERRSQKSEPIVAPAATSNVRVSARIKERTSTGRNRQFPYTDDYVDLDGLEKRSKANNAEAPKRASLRQQPTDTSNINEQMDTATENKETTPKSTSRKRKSTTPIAAVSSKRSRPATPQTLPTTNTRRKQAVSVEVSPIVAKSSRRTTGGQKQAPPAPSPTTPKRNRKSTKQATPTKASPVKAEVTADRPVRIALSSHLNFEQKHFDALRQLGFEIMDESCPVDALVVDRIRRTKKFFICLARGALILSPTWIETMIKENRYIPYEKYFLEDTNAETRYGFQLRESVRLAKQGPIFKNTKFFCTKDTSPPYDDLKDIIEAAGGKLVEKMNMVKPAKDTICIVAQAHKNDYEDLFRKGVSIVSEEFVLSGISKQKLDFDSFSLFQNATTTSK